MGTYILGYESSTTQIRTLSDVMDFLFKLETVEGIDFKIDVQKPPRRKQWERQGQGQAPGDVPTERP